MELHELPQHITLIMKAAKEQVPKADPELPPALFFRGADGAMHLGMLHKFLSMFLDVAKYIVKTHNVKVDSNEFAILLKDATERFMIKTIQEGATELIHVAEAYVLRTDGTDDIPDHPDGLENVLGRREMIIISWHRPKKEMIIAAPINLDRSVGAWEILPTEHSEGRFTNLFTKAQEAPDDAA